MSHAMTHKNKILIRVIKDCRLTALQRHLVDEIKVKHDNAPVKPINIQTIYESLI